MAAPVRITAYRDGPLIVRGDVELVDARGRTLDTCRRPMALCRCGKSRVQPFCDGTHKLAGFKTPSPPPAGPAADEAS